MDLTASILRIAGAEAPKARPLDGLDILRHVEGNASAIPRKLYWRARRGKRTERAVRDGDLKYLHRRLENGKVTEFLFHLEDDPGEKRNLIETRPAAAERLRGLLRDWEAEVRPER